MPKKVGTTQWRKQRRKAFLEKKEYCYYIFCEGEQTEPLYFGGFKRMLEDNPIDKDSFSTKDFNGVEERSDKFNVENPEQQYHMAWSNECMSWWKKWGSICRRE